MYKTVLMLIAVLLLFGSCKIETKKDLGPVVTRTVSVQEFNKLDIAISSDVEYIPSDTFSVTVSAPEKYVDRVAFSVTDHTLSIARKKKSDEGNVAWIINNNTTEMVKIVVRAPSLTCVDISGSGSFVCRKTLKAPKLTLAIAGSGDIDIADIMADSLQATIAGSGEIDAHLSAVASTAVSVSGSGDVDLKLARCGVVKVEIAGSGDVDLSGTAQAVYPTIAGSGEVNTNHLKLTK